MVSASVLVVYASRHGATQGVAERLAADLRGHGHEVELVRAERGEAVGGHDAVILGSPVYGRRWLPEATRFASDHAGSLAACRVWLFSVGTFGDTTRVLGRLALQEPQGIGALRRRLGARGYRVFAGVIHRNQWPAPSRLLFRALGGRFGDNRDWPAIDAWAGEIARALGPSAAG